MRIIPLSEGRFTIDGTKEFIPFNPDTDDLSLRSKGSLLVEIQPFVVITAKDIILLDAGLGFTGPSGNLQILENLSTAGIRPEAITKVLLSHLHKDHSGGMFHNGQPVFPKAQYYVNRNEWEHAMKTGWPSYNTSDFNALSDFSHITWLDENGLLAEGIECEVSGGHCPYHTVFRIRENGDLIFFGGDVAPQWKQMITRYITKYDAEPRKSMELRLQWWKQGQHEKWQFLFYHDISHPVVAL